MFPDVKRDTTGEERKLPCNRCGPKKRHVVECSHSQIHQDDHEETYWFHYETCRCSGCDAVVFREAWYTSHEQNRDSETGEISLDEHVELWHTAAPRDQGLNPETLPEKFRAAYVQTRATVRAGHRILAALGLRTLLESVCVQRRAKGRNLKEKVKSLAPASTNFKAGTLHKVRFLGNDAAHRLDEPEPAEIEIGMKLVENILEALYILPAKAAKEIAGRRDRKPRKKKSSAKAAAAATAPSAKPTGIP